MAEFYAGEGGEVLPRDCDSVFVFGDGSVGYSTSAWRTTAVSQVAARSTAARCLLGGVSGTRGWASWRVSRGVTRRCLRSPS
eukprot:3297916-Alexandrium_andersonii.AAC.1